MLLLCHIPMAGRPSENIFVRDPHHQSRRGPTHQGLHSTHRLILDDGNTPPCFAGRGRGARGISTGISAMHSTEVFGRVVNAFSPRFLDVLAQGVFKGKRQSQRLCLVPVATDLPICPSCFEFRHAGSSFQLACCVENMCQGRFAAHSQHTTSQDQLRQSATAVLGGRGVARPDDPRSASSTL